MDLFVKIIYIAIVFLSPFAISMIISSIIVHRIISQDLEIRADLKGNEIKFFKYVLTLHADKGLSEQGLLWLSIITPIAYFFFTGWFAWKDHSPQLDEAGLKTFMDISTLPLAILSLSLALTILVSRLHATKQTAEQIKITKQKNNIDLFMNHRNELFSYFSQIGETKYPSGLIGKNHIHPRLHKKFFLGEPSKGTPLPNLEAFDNTDKEINSLFHFLDAVVNNINPDFTFSSYVSNFCPQTYAIASDLGLGELLAFYKNQSIRTRPDENGQFNETVGGTTDHAVHALRYINEYFDNLCDFAGYKRKMVPSERYPNLSSGNAYSKIATKVIEQIVNSLIRDNNTQAKTNKNIVIS